MSEADSAAPASWGDVNTIEELAGLIQAYPSESLAAWKSMRIVNQRVTFLEEHTRQLVDY